MGFAKFYHVIACPYAATSLWKTRFPPLPLNRNAHHLLSFHGPFFPANLPKICMKLDGRQVETPPNMNPTCTDQTWSRSSRSCRKILLPDVPMAHPPPAFHLNPIKCSPTAEGSPLLYVTLVGLLLCLISVNLNELHVPTAVPGSRERGTQHGRKLGTCSCSKWELVISECHKEVLASGINPCRHNEFKEKKLCTWKQHKPAMSKWGLSCVSLVFECAHES